MTTLFVKQSCGIDMLDLKGLQESWFDLRSRLRVPFTLQGPQTFQLLPVKGRRSGAEIS